MASQEPFEKHKKLVHYVAHRVHRRMYAAGARSVQVEDVFSELCVAWCIARDNWQPEHQVPFGPYLMRGMSNHINRWVDKELRQFNMAPFELDADLSEDGDGSLHDILGDQTTAQPDDALIEKDLREFARDPMRWQKKLRSHKPLTDNALKFLELLESPPPEIMEILKALNDRAEYGRNTLKIPKTYAPKGVTAKLLFDLMGVSSKEREEITTQLELLGDRVSQQ